MLLLPWLLTCGLAAPETNLALVATLTCQPALDGAVDELVDGRLAAKAFAVGTKGPGQVTLTWPTARRLTRVRLVHSSEVYRLDSAVIEAAGEDGTFRTVAELPRTPLGEWCEARFTPVETRSLRIRATAGEAKGQRAYPCFSEIEAWGAPQAGDAATLERLGRPLRSLTNAIPARQVTPLIAGDRPPAILAPRTAAAKPAVDQLVAALTARLGRAPAVVSDIAAAPLGQGTVIALGNVNDNPLLTRLYFNRYTFEDALFPGPDGYTVHAVYNPFPWGGGHDVIVLGASVPGQLGAAVERFLGLLTGQGAATALPYVQVVEPSRRLTDAARAALLKREVDPSLTAFRQHAEEYLKSGDETYAQLAKAALDIMVGVYEQNPDRHVPWPEETTSGRIQAIWDAFEECPILPAERRSDYVNVFFQFTRGLVPNSYEYRKIDESFKVTWNHTTFPLLGIYYGGRYFVRDYHLRDAQEWLAKSRMGFRAQANCWKPLEDADGYLTLTIGHTIDFSLAEWDLRFFETGQLQQYADYVVACGDNRQWPAGFGDSGYSSTPSMALNALPLAFWWTRDGGYRWILEQTVAKGWATPFHPEVPAVRPDRFVGLQVHRLAPRIYEDTQTRPTYNEEFVKAAVSEAEAFDKIAFRESWEPEGQYLLLDGLGRGKHLHFDTNAIIEFVQDGERWLLDHDYLTRNTTEHAMLSVLRDGRATALVPSLAALRQAGELPAHAAVTTAVTGYNGIDWERRILWRKGAWFLVQDTATAREAGRYDLELTWKTIDRGAQRVEADGRFIAERPPDTGTRGVTTEPDPSAPSGRVVLLGQQGATLSFACDLPAGTYTVAVVARGVDGGSDSLWVSVDGGQAADHHVPQGQYGPSAGSWDGQQPAARLTLDRGGQHVVAVSLRENPPIRIDRVEFRRAGAEPVVVPAATAPPPPPDPARQVVSALHIDPAVGVEARVTNHVRQGLSVPVSILHQRRAAQLQPAQDVTLASLVWATDARKRATYAVAPLRAGVYRVTGGPAPVTVGTGRDAVGGWAVEAAAWCVEGDGAELFAAGALTLGAARLTFRPAADVVVKPNQLTVVATAATTVAATGLAGEWPRSLPAGRHELAVPGLNLAALREVTGGQAPAVAPPAATAVEPGSAQPVWVTAAAQGAVNRLTPADLDGDGRQELLVAAGTQAVCLDAAGAVRWTFPTSGLVRDVSVARFAQGQPPTVLVSSADTWLYLLDPAGKEVRRHQMTGIYFSADHGERPWPLYLTRAVDADGDGVDELVVTTLGSMEALGFDGQLQKQWRTLAAYHGCMDLLVRDVDADGTPEILIADKYGRFHVLAPNGKVKGGVSTSIGDVAGEAVDLDGDGQMELLNGSSTGDLVASDLKGTVRWRFDNYGYAVNRVRAADLTGDGRPEVLVASGTGYVYAVDAVGQRLWERRLGFAVNDLTVHGRQVLCATADGQVVALDAQGQTAWAADLGAAVLTLAGWTAPTGDQALAGLADGRVAALALR